MGKSSVTMSLLNRDFSTEYDPTIEDSYSVTLAVEGKEYAVEIIDTAGQEECTLVVKLGQEETFCCCAVWMALTNSHLRC